MKNRTPVPRDQRPPLPDFAPVPRKCQRHDGWTPARQKAFIEALADTGSVEIACREVNMSSVGAYHLRRQPGAEGFRRAWDAALDMGVQRLKDAAMHRALYGEVVPIFVNGKHAGFRRKYNDRLLMFCLRHFTADPIGGRKVTVNYHSSKATAAAAASPSPLEGEGGARPGEARVGGRGAEPAAAAASAEVTTVRTTVTAPATTRAPERDDAAAAVLDAFQGVPLDAEAEAEILAALERAAVRRRAQLAAADTHGPEALAPDSPADFLRTDPALGLTFLGPIESGIEEGPEPFRADEPAWETLGPGGWAEQEAAMLEGIANRAAEAAAPPEPPAPARTPPPEPEPEPEPELDPDPEPDPEPSSTEPIDAKLARLRHEQQARIDELRRRLDTLPALTPQTGDPPPTPADLRRLRRKAKEGR